MAATIGRASPAPLWRAGAVPDARQPWRGRVLHRRLEALRARIRQRLRRHLPAARRHRSHARGSRTTARKPLVFQGETAAFHPRHGNVRVAASSVRNGFVAFSYSDEFQASISDRSLREARKVGQHQQHPPKSIRHLARYARERLRLRGALDPLEIQYLGGMVYIETVHGLRDVRPVDRAGLVRCRLPPLSEFIDAGDWKTTSAAPASPAPLDLPLRVHVRRHESAHRPVGLPVRAATGASPGREQLLTHSDLADRRDRARAAASPRSSI